MCNWGHGESIKNRSFQYSMESVVAEGTECIAAQWRPSLPSLDIQEVFLEGWCLSWGLISHPGSEGREAKMIIQADIGAGEKVSKGIA